MPVCWLMDADEGRALARPSALDNMAHTYRCSILCTADVANFLQSSVPLSLDVTSESLAQHC